MNLRTKIKQIENLKIKARLVQLKEYDNWLETLSIDEFNAHYEETKSELDKQVGLPGFTTWLFSRPDLVAEFKPSLIDGSFDGKFVEIFKKENYEYQKQA